MKFLKEQKISKKAIANIKGDLAHEQLEGEVTFEQIGEEVRVTVDLINLPPSQFLGFHIHKGSECSGDGFKNVGNHYNPSRASHPEHKGDLPSIYSSNGQIHTEFESDKFTVDEIIGKTIIIHSQRDDFTSQPSGDAGDKIACGEILQYNKNKEKNMRFLKLIESKGNNRIVWDDATATAERREITVEDIEEDIHVKQYKNAQELLKGLLDIAHLDEDELEADTLNGKIEEILESLSDPSDGSPNILYISVDGEELDDYVYPYNELDYLDLATCSEKAIKHALLNEYGDGDNDVHHEDENVYNDKD